MRLALTLSILLVTVAIGCTSPNPYHQDGSVLSDGQGNLDHWRPPGTEGGACLPNNQCNPGLECQGGICVRPHPISDGSLFDGQPPDGTQPPDAPVLCDPPGFKQLLLQSGTQGDWTVALESGFTYKMISIPNPGPKRAAAVFDLNQGGVQVAGFVLSLPTTAKSVAEVASKGVQAIDNLVWGTITLVSSGGANTTHDGFQRVSGTTLQIERNTNTNIADIRNLTLAALLDTSPDQLGGLPQSFGKSTLDFVVRAATVLRSDGRAIVICAVTDKASDDDISKETSLIAEDIGSGTGLARANKSAKNLCDKQTVSSLPKNLVDIIWVIDESGSMQSKRANIASNAAKFFSEAQQRGLDFRMGVTNVCDPNGSYQAAVGKFCSTPSPSQDHDGGKDRFLQPSEQSIFSACVNNPPGYEPGMEYGLVNAEEAVKRHLPRAQGDPAKIRVGAQVVIIVVTDEAPQSLKNFLSYQDVKQCVLGGGKQVQVNQAIQPYLDYFSGKPDIQAKINYFHAVAGTCTSTGCSNPPDVAHGYRELAQKLNGKVYDVCQSDLSLSITAIINGIVAAGAPDLLSEVPISASVQVALDGKALSRSRVNGFYHPPLTKRIVFTGGNKLVVGSQVTISYKRWN